MYKAKWNDGSEGQPAYVEKKGRADLRVVLQASQVLLATAMGPAIYEFGAPEAECALTGLPVH
eukprot:1150897-Pelagomonas_calceolata.AAC.12